MLEKCRENITYNRLQAADERGYKLVATTTAAAATRERRPETRE